MNERQRQRLLDRIDRPSGTVGHDIPDEITVRGTTIDIEAFVFECKRLEAITEDGWEEIEAMKTDLRRERLRRKQRLAEADLTIEEGECLAETILGIDRAINALEQLDEPGIGEKLRREELRNARELISLVRQYNDR